MLWRLERRWWMAFAALLYIVHYLRRVSRAVLHHHSDLAGLVAQCPALHAVFYPHLLFSTGLLQTALMGHLPGFTLPRLARQLVSIEGGGQVAVDWFHSATVTPETPCLVLFPGNLGGSSEPYMQRLLAVCSNELNWRVCVCCRRGAANVPLTTAAPQNYSNLEDVESSVALVCKQYPLAPKIAIGFSLGGNYLLRYLSTHDQFVAAAVIGTPFSLLTTSFWLMYSSKICEAALVGGEVITARLNAKVWGDKYLELEQCTTYRELIRKLHLPVHQPNGDLDQYLHKATVHERHLAAIKTPTLVISALDDPVVPNSELPVPMKPDINKVLFAITRSGGHHSYLGNDLHEKLTWSEHAVIEWLQASMHNKTPN